MPIAKRLNLRLFIDGMEVPVIGARCSFSENTDASADIQVIATDEVFEILPRSMILLFYYEDDDYTYKEGAESGLGVLDLRRWKILFAGELASVQLQKTDAQRAAILSCVGPMNYLDFIRQHYLNFRSGGIEFYENAFMGVTADKIKNYDVIGKGMDSNLFVWLSASKVTVDGEKYSNLYTGTQRVIREMFFASSVFYAQAFNRWRIGDIVVGLPEDKTAAKLMKLSFFKKFMKNQVGGSGGHITARQMITMLLRPVMHTMTTIPCPWFDSTGKALGNDIQDANSGLSDVIIANQVHPDASLNYVVIKPDTWFLAPPVCNIVLPHQYSTLSYQRSYLAEPTRLMMRTSLFFGGRSKWLTERFYAPDFSEVAEVMYKEGGHLDRMAEILMPHEEFVGLNPLFLWEEDLGAYVQRGGRRDYLSKLCDYLFWKYRFSTRTANVSGPFNPNLVPGFPGLVFDQVGTTLTRHLVGNIQTVVHSIDQQGGQTHFTMQGCYRHDETVDFDKEGRSVNDVTRRGTDGFLDDRYDWENIGKDVYSTILGCGSLYDITEGMTSGKLVDEIDFTNPAWSALDADSDPLIVSVAYLQLLYQTVIQNEGNVQAFTQSLTQRPKANMAELVGVIEAPEGATLSEEEQAALDVLYGAGFENSGFFSAAIDPDSPVDDSYTTRRSYTRTTTTETPAVENTKTDSDGAEWVESITPARSQTTTSSHTDTETTNYKLKEMVKARQYAVSKYIKSLTYQGLRG